MTGVENETFDKMSMEMFIQPPTAYTHFTQKIPVYTHIKRNIRPRYLAFR